MLNLKKGDVVVMKDSGEKCTVTLVLDGITFTEATDGESNWYNDKEMQQIFILPTEKWVPEGNYYYMIDMNNRGVEPVSIVWGNDKFDKANLETGNCFRTQEEAEAKAEEIRKVLKK